MLETSDSFAVAPDLREWIFDTFIDDQGPLTNVDHAHLQEAEIGVLWTNCLNRKAMRQVIGQSELMPPMAMGKWQRARAISQIEDWFGEVPDFLITFDAHATTAMTDVSFCALVEHELYHCAQDIDQYGAPKFTQDGRPKFAIRGHDVEECTGVVRRYGATATGIQEFVDAANTVPLIGQADIGGVCGTCGLKAV